MRLDWKAPFARAGAKLNGYLVRHWRGELPLAVSYWANLVALNLVHLLFAQVLIVVLLGLEIDTFYIWYYSLAWALVTFSGVWFMVGVWRSAERRMEHSPSFWARAAQASVGLQAVLLVVIFGTVGLPAIKESVQFSKLMTGLAYEVRVLPGGKELELVGGVGRGLDKKVLETLDRNPSIRVVHVNLYKGGLVRVARRLREKLRERKLTTYVSGACVSACTEVFLGGERRSMRVGAKIGFHGPMAPGMLEPVREFLLYRERSHLTSLGIEKSFAAKALRVEPKDMWYPSAQELIEAGVIDGVTAGEEFAQPGPPATAERDEMEADLLKYPLYQALKRKEPRAYEQIVGLLVAGLVSGEPLNETRQKTGRIIRELYRIRLPYAGAGALQRVSALFSEQFRLLRKKSTDSCWNAGAGGGPLQKIDYSNEMPESFRLQESEVMAEVFDTADMSRKLPSPDGKVARAVLERIQSNARFRVRSSDRNPAGPDDPSTDKVRECDFKMYFYEELAIVPVSESAPSLHWLFMGMRVPAYR